MHNHGYMDNFSHSIYQPPHGSLVSDKSLDSINTVNRCSMCHALCMSCPYTWGMFLVLATKFAYGKYFGNVN